MLSGDALAVMQRLGRLMPALAAPDNAQPAELLAGMIAGRSLPHAVIIESDDAVQSGIAARLTARAYLCSCPTPLEGGCRACHLFEAYGSHPDMYVAEGSGASGAISVDSVREAKKRGDIIPTDAAGTVCLLERGELMLRPAQNALLKLLEEPPDGLMLIMTCTTRMKLLETIRSRGTIFHFEWPPAPADSDRAAAQKTAAALAEALLAPSDADAMFVLAPLCSGSSRADGKSMRRQLQDVLDIMGGLLRRAALVSVGADKALEDLPDDGPESAAAVHALSAALSVERLAGLIRELEPLKTALKNNASMPLLCAAAVERMRRAAGK